MEKRKGASVEDCVTKCQGFPDALYSRRMNVIVSAGMPSGRPLVRAGPELSPAAAAAAAVGLSPRP
jgi:hypothetical protein